MYGLLLDSIQKFLREKYGEHYWVIIRRRAMLDNHWFVTHEVYSDSVMSNLVDSAASVLGEERDRVMQMFGEYFVQTIGRYGYARLLRVLGRDLRDFLNGLDNLHEYLRFSYPKMRPPSFFCEQETSEGMIMHYTTTRSGYLPYVIGQLYAVGSIYQKELDITVLSEYSTSEGLHFVLNLNFDNKEMLKEKNTRLCHLEFQISSQLFLDLFPFAIVFDSTMHIIHVGEKIHEVMPNLVGREFNHVFEIHRPCQVVFEWESITMHTNCVFEMRSTEATLRQKPRGIYGKNSPSMQYKRDPPPLTLKGQMELLSSQSDYMIFLCSPVLASPEDLYESGIFISDMPMHDSSREYTLAGSQQHPELSLALNQEQIRSKQLEDNIQKTDSLLYQMIPKLIADKLSAGETPLNTCKQWPCVSILFADIVGFTPMCSRLTPMEVVCLLNAIYVIFDELCEKHFVYKVQTIGDACMVLSGAPVEVPNHAELITEYGFSIIDAIGKVLDPSTRDPLSIRVGIHSGTVVAGVVGSAFIRYDVFGDTVNTAARMEATGQPMKIHVSEATAILLEGTNFIVEKRGEMEVKGKGTMKTFWVTGKKKPANEISKPIRPKSPMYETSRRLSSKNKRKETNTVPSDIWPRHKSVPSVLMPPKQSRDSLTPERWPELDESLYATPDRSPVVTPVPRNTSAESTAGISIEDTEKLLALTQTQASNNNGVVSIGSLSELVQYTEENAQRSRRVADWAKTLLTLSESQAEDKEDSNKTLKQRSLSSIEESPESPPASPMATNDGVHQHLPDQTYPACVIL